MQPEQINIVWQSFDDSPLGRVSKAAFNSNSRGISRPRILRNYAIVYLLNGKGRFEDNLGNERDISAGDLIILFPDVPHRYGPREGEDWSEFYILFQGQVFDQWRASGLLDPAKPVHHLEPVGYWLRRFQSVVETPPGARQLYPLACVCKLQQVLADVLVSIDEGRINAADRRWLDQARALLEQPGPAEEIDWNELAGKLHMSYENFRKRFARLAGIPPSRYRMRGVMERAAEHLLQSRLTLKEVADLCGFCNEFHFSRRFKQIVGLSPRDFRKQLPH